MLPRGTILRPVHHPSRCRSFEIVLILVARDAQRAQLRPREFVPEGPNYWIRSEAKSPNEMFFYFVLEIRQLRWSRVIMPPVPTPPAQERVCVGRKNSHWNAIRF